MADDEYARSAAKVVAAQMLAAHGVDGTQRSTLDILADLLLRYTAEIGRQSHMYAELSHRTDCNYRDVVSRHGGAGPKSFILLKTGPPPPPP